MEQHKVVPLYELYIKNSSPKLIVTLVSFCVKVLVYFEWSALIACSLACRRFVNTLIFTAVLYLCVSLLLEREG